MYDLIGDIHGHADALERLLAALDYQKKDGLWSHPERRVIFLGDFIDRGPQQVETVRIAQAMVEAGQALAVMGNHEFNAVAWATPDPQQPDQYLRVHSDKNYGQHQAYLEQVGEGSELHRQHIDWFKTLPLHLDLEGLRVIHACWHPPSLRVLNDYTDQQQRILEDAWPTLCQKGKKPSDALETAIKGLELRLPSGYEFFDKDGNPHQHIRTRWWELEHLTYRDLAMVPSDQIEAIPHTPIPEHILPGYAGDKPLFVGHYWMTGEPEPLNRYIACLDYSIAASGTQRSAEGKLCAYRWRGEGKLTADNMVWVEGE
ncbi:metallophosphoesterase [Halomonas chromatireducens]|uniref:Bis(5'-nucleosyl)-tetraphosphatase PrpE n=1 Tax=Halomonas chromatireducens TaxID=507626 RepID=A0A109ULI8_9GAMM|nr:metallophosphoesterase [Halomonas chromatireducens]AMD00547.1 Bis(5'-nucleosyl)-tetraphosphatase PrpE [Halomonas chromatireducens]